MDRQGVVGEGIVCVERRAEDINEKGTPVWSDILYIIRRLTTVGLDWNG